MASPIQSNNPMSQHLPVLLDIDSCSSLQQHLVINQVEEVLVVIYILQEVVVDLLSLLIANSIWWCQHNINFKNINNIII